VSDTETAAADPTTEAEEPPASRETGTDEPSTQAARMPLGRSRPVLRAALRSPAAAVLLVLAVLAVGRLGLGERHSAQTREQAERTDQAVLSAARQEVLALTGLDGETAQSQLDRAIAGATGSFKSQMQSSAAAFKSVVSGDKVVSTGTIDGIGVKSVSGGSATVLVAAEAKVSNKTNAKGENRLYRLSVTLRKIQGKWLVSTVEMVS
jgi:Mce-associated membrane protein